MRLRLAICASALIATIGAWTVLASRLFVWMGGLSGYFPSPWGTWWLYARQPRIDGSTLLYLIASGIIAALPVLLIIAPIVMVVRRMVSQSPVLYGKTGWATKVHMKAGGISSDRHPF